MMEPTVAKRVFPQKCYVRILSCHTSASISLYIIKFSNHDFRRPPILPFFRGPQRIVKQLLDWQCPKFRGGFWMAPLINVLCYLILAPPVVLNTIPSVEVLDELILLIRCLIIIQCVMPSVVPGICLVKNRKHWAGEMVEVAARTREQKRTATNTSVWEERWDCYC